MAKLGIVILSRYSSNRLPGKALIKIQGKEVLKYIIERLERKFQKECLTIATSKEQSDDFIEDFAKKENISCYRGSLNDVASRFYEAAHQKGWEYAVRICGDNIFTNMETLEEMAKIADAGRYDFLSNKKNNTFPPGMSVEMVRVDYFRKLLKEIKKSKRYKEHVTLYLYEKDKHGKHYYCYNRKNLEAGKMKLALDTQEDLARIKNIIKNFTKPQWTYGLDDIFQIWKELGY